MGDIERLRTIGKALQEEEQRFIGYSEIERKTRELGFGVSVRTLRFYVEERILPAPRKVGKTPVYEEEWILNALLGLHLMKTRFTRSLTEIRAVLGSLQEDPEILADKLSVLYEDYAKQDVLKPLERAGLIDAFFGLLVGRGEAQFQASRIRLTDLAECVANEGSWNDESWTPPSLEAILASQGVGSRPKPPAAPAEAPPEEPTSAASPLPEGAISAREARNLEHTFISRFKLQFERLGRVHCPLDGKGYKAGPREHSSLREDRSAEIYERMKALKVYERSLLDALPVGEQREFCVYQRGLFGRGDMKVVVTAVALSPMDELITQRHAKTPLGPADAKRTVGELEQRDGVFHYVGILSTTGWTRAAQEGIPSRRSMLCALIEPREDGSWRVHRVEDERWGGMEALFDPETDEEKVDRVREYMAGRLRPRGEFVILRNLSEDLDVPQPLVQTAVEELLASDSELGVLTMSGREILKRSRL